MQQIYLLFDLFITFFQIGLFTIGGGYAMIPLITERVLSKNWATEIDLLDYIAVAESTPGPFALNTATFIGMKQSGIPGAAAACLGLILPSFVIILVIARFFMKFIEYRGVSAAMNGLRPAVIGLMSAAVISVASTAFNIKFSFGSFSLDFIKSINYLEIFIFLTVLALSQIKKLKIDSYKIILVSAALGVLAYSVRDWVLA